MSLNIIDHRSIRRPICNNYYEWTEACTLAMTQEDRLNGPRVHKLREEKGIHTLASLVNASPSLRTPLPHWERLSLIENASPSSLRTPPPPQRSAGATGDTWKIWQRRGRASVFCTFCFVSPPYRLHLWVRLGRDVIFSAIFWRPPRGVHENPNCERQSLRQNNVVAVAAVAAVVVALVVDVIAAAAAAAAAAVVLL